MKVTSWPEKEGLSDDANVVELLALLTVKVVELLLAVVLLASPL